MEKRKHYLDNIRWITLCFVIIYHIFYIFNSSGVVSNIGVTGIKELDSICIFIYPWIMCLLFVVSGVSTNYSLKSKTNKEFIKDRAKRILVPSLIGIFVYGWISGWTTNYYGDIFAGNGSMIPVPIKYIIFSLIGIGPLWYAHVLFIASLLIVLVRKIDKNKKLDILFSKINLPLLFSLVLLVWGSSFILNTPVVTVYRFGIYLLMFLLGYYIFSDDEIIEKLEKISIQMGIITFIIGITFTIVNYGANFGSNEFLTNIFTNIYIWFVILSAFGLAKKFLDFENKFTKYMNKNNFSFYVLHYTIQIIIAFVLVEYFKFSHFLFNYIILFIGTIIILPIVTEILKRIPIANKLLLGVSKRK